jgi:membrane glycosyltransferase
VVIPIYNEDPWRVFAGLAAMHESVVETHGGEGFDFFVLSDTSEPPIWLEEELAWALTTDRLRPGPKVHYRRRPHNEGRKSGNIADFCRRWGSGYKYMIVLDADSVVSGPTMVEMVRRMEADPELGLLQAPPVPVNRGSLFARLQEFSAGVYGKVFTAGYGLWSQTDGNYWGHNAIIRLEPFIRHCGLPTLSGRPPFGGEILSHDFVEAAFLRRAGWKIHLADDLSGSYEECPATLIDYAKRDQRWCQGNLQHLRIMFRYGLHSLSRLHMGMGVMSYVSSSLWLIFILLGIATAAVVEHTGMTSHVRRAAAVEALGLFAVSMAMLLLPKLWGYLALLRQRQRLAAQGGAGRVALGVLLETLVSILVAPIMMAFHVTFIILALFGRKVQWTAQQREESSTSFEDAFAAHGSHTIYGLAAALLIVVLIPGMIWWFLPILAGLILSIPLSMMLSSATTGRWLHSHGLLTIAEETATPRVLRYQSEHLRLARSQARIRGRVEPFLQVIVDPAFNALHVDMLRSAGNEDNEPMSVQIQALARVAFYGGPRHVNDDDKMAILTSAPAIVWLHQSAWTYWSTETLSRIMTAR